MTALDRLRKDHPDWKEWRFGECVEDDCPNDWEYIDHPGDEFCKYHTCEECWNREIPEEKVNVNTPVMKFDTPDANCRSFPPNVRLDPSYAIDKNGKLTIREISIVSNEEKEKDMTGTKETQCTNCIHREVCIHKMDFLAAQKAVDFLEYEHAKGGTVRLCDIPFIYPIELKCKHFYQATVVRG